MNHHCHALHCATPIPPAKLMCQKHWSMVPSILRDHVWETYRPGQEVDKLPSDAYLQAAYAAIDVVASQEGLPYYETGTPKGLK